MGPSWYFHAVRADNAFGFSWHWQHRRRDGRVNRCTDAFDYYYDCVEDARQHGYRGPFPAGPKVAFKRLPHLRVARSDSSRLRLAIVPTSIESHARKPDPLVS